MPEPALRLSCLPPLQLWALSWELMRGQAARVLPMSSRELLCTQAPPLGSFGLGRSQLCLQGAPGAPGSGASIVLLVVGPVLCTWL